MNRIYIRPDVDAMKPVTKKRKSSNRRKANQLHPKSNEITSKNFSNKIRKKLSSIAKLVLNSFQNKYIYYAIDDILYY
jgi:hypothetical protein